MLWLVLALMVIHEAAREEARYLIEQARSPRLRTVAEFATQEIVLPNGPYRNMRLREAMQPAAFVWFRQLDKAEFNRHAYVGPVQSGKTMNGLVIPLMHTLFERRETAILGAPKMEIAHDKWREDFLPVIKASRYAPLLPERGAGSRGGKPQDHVEFGNGVTLKFMSGQGSDDSRSAYTARFVYVTEVDKMDRPSEVSREADPVSQLEDRTFAFDRFGGGYIFLECTCSNTKGRIWAEYSGGTASRLAIPCPKCEAWVTPERENFRAWECATEDEAAANGRFCCPACGEAWSEEERIAVNGEAKLLHKGQSIDARGRISGETPKTRTLGFRMGAVNNAFVSAASIAIREWRSARFDEDSAERANEEKTLRQKVFAIPYDPPQLDETPLTEAAIKQRTERLWPRGMLPPDTENLTLGLDVGKWWCWWLLIAFRKGGQLHLPDYGRLDVVTDKREDVNVKLLTCLRSFRETVEAGWHRSGSGEAMTPDRVWVDTGYLPDVVCTFLRECGGDRQFRWRPALGRGADQVNAMHYSHPTKKTQEVREIGNRWHARRNQQQRLLQVTFDSDYWKTWFQERLSTTLGERGSCSLFQAPANEHTKIAQHFTNEQRRMVFTPGKGPVPKWEKTGANHWLDCGAMASAAGDADGFSLIESAAQVGPQAQRPPAASWFAQRKGRRG